MIILTLRRFLNLIIKNIINDFDINLYKFLFNKSKRIFYYNLIKIYNKIIVNYKKKIINFNIFYLSISFKLSLFILYILI